MKYSVIVSINKHEMKQRFFNVEKSAWKYYTDQSNILRKKKDTGIIVLIENLRYGLFINPDEKIKLLVHSYRGLYVPPKNELEDFLQNWFD